jgi:two-component system chemotaxis sensor kinase CheA
MMDHQNAFKEEARELLIELETALLDLEKMPTDEEIIGRVFRAMHTLKGSGAMFGFDKIATFTHDVETVYDRIRNGKMTVTKALIDLTLSACDEIQKLLDDPEDGNAGDDTQAETIAQAFREMIIDSDLPAADVANAAERSAKRVPVGNNEVTYRIRFSPVPEIFASGTNIALLLHELRELGTCHVIANTDSIPNLLEINPEACYTRWNIILTTKQDINAIRDVFIFVEDSCELHLDKIDDSESNNAEQGYKKLGEILVERGDLNAAELQNVLIAQKRIGALLVDSGKVSSDQLQAALIEQQHIREVRHKRQITELNASIRVPAEKLDTLVNMVGELVTVQSRLSQLSAHFNDLSLIQVAEEVERLTAELRDNTMSIRMLPIGATFSRFERLVRDLSTDLGKEIVLKTDGAETELDKTVIEKLNDPLIHLIRNSIDHGIEKPKVRTELGKPTQGTIHLAAEHSGASVYIRISDDGAGMDCEAIRAKAIEKGLISGDALLSEKEILALTLAPGFSMAQTITNVSGRGVGMDVVKKSIDALRGSIEIATQKGLGTTITLKLPLTMAIIDGLLVRINDNHYIMPLAAIEECVELTREDVQHAHGKHIANIRGQIVPYINLREMFRYNGTAPAIEQIVTAKIDGSRVGFVVDQVIGQHQTVIKSMSRLYRDIEYISGATILGDGNVALIFDLTKLAHRAEIIEKKTIEFS